MSFAKKQRLDHHESRPQGSKLVMREDKVKHLREVNDPEARKVLKQMNVTNYRTGRTNLGEYWNPNGTRHVRGSDGKARRIAKALKAKATGGMK